MPYIAGDRFEINDHMKRLEQVIKTPGDLNYVISHLLNEVLKDKRFRNGKWGYSDINELVGALESAKLEFYRRVAVPYEDNKMVANGDVYNCFPPEQPK